MSYVIAAPEMLAAAAGDLATIDSSLSVAHTAAAASTVALVPAAADEVSLSTAHLFSRCAEDYQAVARQAAAFHEQLIRTFNASARSYARTEAANASSLPSLDARAGSYASASVGAQILPVKLTLEEALVILLLLPVELPLILLLLVLGGALQIAI
jgi:hypothetical protein